MRWAEHVARLGDQRQDNKFQTQTLKRKQYLVKRPQSGLDTKTY
jgi:hypothetical protein